MCALVLLAVATRSAVPEAAPPDRLLVDRALVWHRSPVASAGDDAVVLASGESLPLSDLLAFLPAEPGDTGDLALAWLDAAPTAQSTAPAVLTLTDGRVLLGRVHTLDTGVASAGVDDLAFDLQHVGPVRVPLDLVARLTLRPPSTPPPDPQGQDLVLLRNGDALRGFVNSLDASVRLESDTAHAALRLADIASVTLANPPTDPASAHAHLADGSVLGVVGVREHTGAQIRLRLAPIDSADSAGSEAAPAPLERTIALHDLLAWRAAPGDKALLPLAHLPTPEFAPAPGRRWTRPPSARFAGAGGIPDIILPGPMHATWALPEGATRFAAAIALDPEAGPWGGCEVRIEAATPGGTRLLAAVPLSPDHPRRDTLADIPAGATSLTVRIIPAQRGPIRDTVHLHRPMLLVQR